MVCLGSIHFFSMLSLSAIILLLNLQIFLPTSTFLTYMATTTPPLLFGLRGWLAGIHLLSLAGRGWEWGGGGNGGQTIWGYVLGPWCGASSRRLGPGIIVTRQSLASVIWCGGPRFRENVYVGGRVEWFMLFLGKSSSNMQRISPNYLNRPYFEAFCDKGHGRGERSKAKF